jgi:hypothetical protein
VPDLPEGRGAEAGRSPEVAERLQRSGGAAAFTPKEDVDVDALVALVTSG